MNPDQLEQRFREEAQKQVPLPGRGQTALRFKQLAELGREDLSLARLVEAHWDATAILMEADRLPRSGARYGVWASESPKSPLTLDAAMNLSGSKAFCSGAGLLDRALVTVASPQNQLIDLDVRSNSNILNVDYSSWKTEAFVDTKTATVTFGGTIDPGDLVCHSGWYLERPGFWSGAIAPAACWAGGAFGLLDYAYRQSRNDSHTMAHLGAMHAAKWALQSYLEAAGRAIDAEPDNSVKNRVLARTVRHLIEQACSDILLRLGRAYGPHPLAMDTEISRRCQELALYIRQCHAERDLEPLGLDIAQLGSR